VRTAFPTSGGFDEKVTLFCLHASGSSGRQFGRFLPLAATQCSVYAPDLPGCGESDPAPTFGPVDAAAAVADLATDLRLRQLDVLGFREGAAVAVEFAFARPDLVRRVILIRGTASLRLPSAATVIDAADYPEDPFEAAPQAMVEMLDSVL